MNKRMFVFHQGALGDFILALQALDRIASRPRIDLCCQDHLGTLALSLGFTSRTIPLERGHAFTLFSPQPHEDIINLLALYDSAILFSNSEDLYRTVEAHIKGPVYRVPPRQAKNATTHMVDYFLEHIGASFSLTDDQRSFLTPPHKEASPHLPILIHPGSGSLRKNWPLERFVALSALLESKGITCQWILGPAEHSLEEGLKTDIHPSIIQCVDNLIDVVHLLRESCAFVGNDSGLSHLAAFLGIPTVAVFGPSCAAQWAPRGPAVSVVQSSLGCEPCFEDQQNCETLECLKSIEAEAVLAAVLRTVNWSTR